MARVEDWEVQALLDTEANMWPYIETATLVVDEDLSGAGHSAARLKQIELYLAAHYACVSTPLLMQARSDQDSFTYQMPDAGAGFKATSYGQQAVVLDTSGTLALLGVVTKASFEVL